MTTKLSTERLVAFGQVLEATGNVTTSAKAAKIAPKTAYRWKDASLKNPEDRRFHVPDEDDPTITYPLHEVWDLCLRISMDAVEEAMRHQATGIDEPVIYEGRLMYEIDPDGQPTVDKDPISGDVTITPCYKRDPIDGKPIVLTVRKYVTQAGLNLLKAHRPEKYRENVSLDVSAQKGGVLCVPMVMSQEDYDKAFSGPGKSPDWTKEQMTPPPRKVPA